MTWPRGDPDTVVRSVLADGSYRSVPGTTALKPHATLPDVVWDWVRERVVEPLLHPLGHALAASRDAGTILGIGLLALVCVGLFYVAFRLALAFVRSPAKSTKAELAARELAAPQDARGWQAAAAVAARRGDYAQAIAALFSAALVELDVRGIVPLDAARTPGEYRRLVFRTSPAAAQAFDELAERFVSALYAPQAPEPEAFEAAARALAALEPALAR